MTNGIIEREDFYAAFEELKATVKRFEEIEKIVGTELTESIFGDILEGSYNIFSHLIFGKNQFDETLFDAMHSDYLTFYLEDDNGEYTITESLKYDDYYDYFVNRVLD